MTIDKDTGECKVPLSIYKAFFEVQRKVGKVKKDSKGHNSRYASLGAVCDAVYPILEDYGVFVSQPPTRSTSGAGAGVLVVTEFVDVESGDTLRYETDCPMELKKLSDPQAFGSSISYARRYALLSILGLVTEDDDGHSARVSFESEADNISRCDNSEDLKGVMRYYKDLPLAKRHIGMLTVLAKHKLAILEAQEKEDKNAQEK